MENINKHFVLQFIGDALADLRGDELADLQRQGQIVQARWDEKRQRLHQARSTIEEVLQKKAGA